MGHLIISDREIVAQDAWGEDLSDWIMTLVRECPARALSLMAVRAFPKTDTARCILAQCAGTVRHGEFQMLAAEAGFAGLQPDPTAILSDIPSTATETPKPEPLH